MICSFYKCTKRAQFFDPQNHALPLCAVHYNNAVKAMGETANFARMMTEDKNVAKIIENKEKSFGEKISELDDYLARFA